MRTSIGYDQRNDIQASLKNSIVAPPIKTFYSSDFVDEYMRSSRLQEDAISTHSFVGDRHFTDNGELEVSR